MDGLRNSITEMHAGMVNVQKKTEEVIKAHKRKNYEGVEEGLQLIKNGLIKHKRQAEEMKQEVSTCEKVMSSNQNRITHLEDWLGKLQPQVDNLMRKNQNTNIARIANSFEVALATHIYPRDTKVTFSPIFPSLMLWLNENKDTSEGIEGNRKWKAFVEKFNWSEEHERVFFKMLKFGKEIDHKNVHFHLEFTKKEERIVDAICEMSQQLNFN